MSDILLGNKPIGPQHPPFMIAELSSNNDLAPLTKGKS